MKITNIVLHNFGIYANTNKLDLTSNKPVVLIGGMNGRGKTTLLEAVLLALYGRRSFAFAENKLSFPNYLKRLVNKSDATLKTYIELNFELFSGNELEHYRVRREWSLHTTVPNLLTTVYKNEKHDQILSENWDLFIEDILPNAIAPFFFFDGEKISELANSDNDKQMKESIKNLLGINVIDQTITDIRKIITNKKHTFKAIAYEKEIASFETLIKNANDETKKIKETLASYEVRLYKINNKLQGAENTFSSMGGNFVLNRQELEANQIAIQKKLAEVDELIMELVSEDLPLLFTLPLLKDILLSSESERDEKAIKSALEKLPELYKKFDGSKEHDINFDEFMHFIQNNSKEVPIVYNLSEEAYIKLKSLYSVLLNHQREDVIKLLAQRKELRSEQVKNENYLSINIDDSAVTKKYQEVLRLTKELATVNEQYRITQQLFNEKLAALENLKHQQLKVIEKAVSDIENATDTKRLIMYAGYSLKVLEEYKIRLQRSKTQALAATMTNCFKQIASKQNLISEIQLNAETLDFIYLDSEGGNIARSSFSAGEKQLLVIAMLWALGICSQKKFPVIIDTPLARLDSIHRETLITNYFPHASEQTILLSTDSEVYGKYYDLLYSFVGKEYTLVYKEETKHTTVQRGYFTPGGKL
jgi:DNA sulfur modification protein DndD